MSLIMKKKINKKKIKVLQLTDQALHPIPAIMGCAIDYVENGFIVYKHNL